MKLLSYLAPCTTGFIILIIVVVVHVFILVFLAVRSFLDLYSGTLVLGTAGCQFIVTAIVDVQGTWCSWSTGSQHRGGRSHGRFLLSSGAFSSAFSSAGGSWSLSSTG